jgi:iron complex outermembrane recepter protein
MTKSSLCTTVALASCLLFPHAAFAQDVEGAANAPAAAADDIIVTAQRREGTVQDTPMAISVLSGEQMASAQINDPTRLTNATTGVQISTVGQQLTLFVRGAGAPVANVRADPAAAYSVDGIAIARPVSVNGSYYDLARVEVVKGPQGTLYGRNSTVGAINIITNRPTFDLEGAAELEVGNYNLVRGEAMLNVPLSETVAIRAAGQLTGFGHCSSHRIAFHCCCQPVTIATRARVLATYRSMVRVAAISRAIRGS